FVIALIIGNATSLVTVILCNLFLNLADAHYAWQFLSNFSIMRFAFEALLLLEYGFGRCNQDEIQLFLHDRSLQDSDYSRIIAILIFNVIFWRCFAVYLLVCKSNPKENSKKCAKRIQKNDYDLNAQ